MIQFPKSVVFGSEDYSTATTVWEAFVAENNFYYRSQESWTAERPGPESHTHLGEILYWYESNNNAPYTEIICLMKAGQAMHLTFNRGNLTVHTAATTRREALELILDAEHLFPKKETPDNGLYVTFWSNAQRGPSQFARNLSAPDWSDIAMNYTEETRTPLGKLMEARYNSESSGKLILWQGMPGTGKTFALRSLAKSWRKWAKMHYIMDPEQFFGADANYMIGVIMGESLGLPAHMLDDDDDEDDEDSEIPPQRIWRLLVLEDAGELTQADAKMKTGQALSRLLNVCDGIIGQGLRVLVLITTNEDLSSLHPAVTRPGRLASKVVFKPFPNEEATQWLQARDPRKFNISEKPTLAELYAMLAGEQISEPRKNDNWFKQKQTAQTGLKSF